MAAPVSHVIAGISIVERAKAICYENVASRQQAWLKYSAVKRVRHDLENPVC